MCWKLPTNTNTITSTATKELGGKIFLQSPFFQRFKVLQLCSSKQDNLFLMSFWPCHKQKMKCQRETKKWMQLNVSVTNFVYESGLLGNPSNWGLDLRIFVKGINFASQKGLRFYLEVKEFDKILSLGKLRCYEVRNFFFRLQTPKEWRM